MSDVLDLFVELAAVPSPPGEERAVSDRVTRYLQDCGLGVDEDDFGNLYTRLEPTADGEPLLLCAHLDTVPPTDAIEPHIVDDVVTNKRPTILGADDKSAVAVMLEATRALLSENRPHAGVELLFTMQEEIGLRGAAAFDHSKLRANVGYVYDQAAPIGTVILGAPYAVSMDVTFHGRASHSGMYPDEGRSAIAAASRAIAEMRLGRVDEVSTANVGTITGGTATNIIPEWCSFTAEARSHEESRLAELVQAMQDAITFAAGVAECDVETKIQRSYHGYRFAKSDRPVEIATAALERTGYEVVYELSGGAADANVFNERGLAVVNLANGMTDIHTPDERIAVADLDGMVAVTLALVESALG